MLWITRPAADAEQLLSALEARGVSSIVSPLLDVEMLSFDLGAVNQIEGLIATSRNGLRGAVAGGLSETMLSLPLFVVGQGTARLAREFGFKDVRVPHESGGGAVLADFISHAGLSGKTLLHFRGDKIAFDLRRQLKLHGICVEECQTYRMIGRTTIASEVLDMIEKGTLEGVVLMSPRTARLYGAAMSRAGLDDKMADFKHYCLSGAVAATLRDWPVREIEIAVRPDLEALVAVIAAPLVSS